MSGSGSNDIVRRPTPGSEKWEQMLVYALWRSVGGMSQEEAAGIVGVSGRSGRRWERQVWWQDIREATAKKFMGGLIIKARAGLMTLVENCDGPSIRYVLDRLDPLFSPPSMRTTVRDREGHEVEVEVGPEAGVQVTVYIPDNNRPDITPEEAARAREVGTAHLVEPSTNGGG